MAYPEHRYYEGGGVNGHPRKSIIVICTPKNRGWEYRVGVVTDADFKEGLRMSHDVFALNTHVAVRCFGKAKVHKDQGAAEKEARARTENVGVKIFNFNSPFPNQLQ